MTSINQNVNMYAGDTINVNFGISNSDNTAASLSSASPVWIMEQNVSSGSLLRKTSDSGISISGSTITVSISPSDTIDFAGTYYHELEVTDTSGNVSTVSTGLLTIKKSGAKL